MALTSPASSTTHNSAASRRGSRQIGHGSASDRLPHVAHAVTWPRTLRMASANRSATSAGCFSKWNVSRWAVLRPMPGSLASSATSSSMADTGKLQGQLERERQPRGQLADFRLIQLGRALLRLRHRGEHQVLEHLDVALADRLRIDLDPATVPSAIDRGLNDAATGRYRQRLLRQLRLYLGKPPLHLLGELEQAR